MEIFSIIDCGTNTFNLIIVELLPKFRTVYLEKIPVKIGFNLNSSKIITDEGISRAVEAMKIFKQKSIEYNSKEILAIGTSAFRDSLNADKLILKIFEQTSISIKVINGDREAELIARGVFFGWNKKKEKSLIVDIGGGSNECIIVDEQENLLWKKSFPLGIARLLGKYPHSDPIKHDEIKFYEELFYNEMKELWDVIRTFKPTIILGASGAFDTIHEMLEYPVSSTNLEENYLVNMSQFNQLYRKVVFSTLQERMEMKGLVAMRRDMIVLSFIFIDAVIRNSKINKLMCCKGSLKEGVIRDIIEGRWY